MSELSHSKRTTKTKKSSSKPKTAKTSKKSSKKVAAAVAPEALPDVSEVVEEVAVKAPVEESVETVAPTPSTRRIVTKETLDVMFGNFLERLEEQLVLTRENKNRNVTVRTWQSLERDAKKMRSDYHRVAKIKRDTGTRNPNIGFEKKRPVSKEIAKFAGWPVGEDHSRVDVTNAICAYIKENKLQNPSDGRQIVPDKKLAKILQYDKNDEVPLTYFRIQQLIKHHFV